MGHPKNTCLLVANIFAPIHGGSANVYASLCRLSPKDSIVVLAARHNYDRDKPIPGWQEHDLTCGYPIERLELLRSPVLPPPANKLVSIWRRLSIDIPIGWQVLSKALNLIREYQIGVICIGELNSSAWLGELCRHLTGVRVLYYIHGEEVTTEFNSGAFGKRRTDYLKRADAIIAVSDFTRQTLIRLGLPSSRVHLIENAVDTNRFQPSQPDQGFLARWQAHDKQVVVSIGRLVARKGFDRSIQAWPRVLKRYPDAHLIIVGDGPQRQELESLVSQLGLERSITLTGAVSDDDLVAAYQSCIFFLMPNRTLPDGDTEGFGLVFLEANACNKAVIGGRAGGAVEAVKDNHTGLLVDGNSTEEIATAVCKLLEDKLLRQTLERNGLAHAQANSWVQRARQFNALCTTMTEHSSR